MRLVAGAYAASDSYESAASCSAVDITDTRHGLFAALEWDTGEDFTHTAALRWEDYSSHGEEFTWRLGSVWRIPGSSTSLRAGVGTAFRAPSYTDLFYQSIGFSGNPNLESQTSLGWELGVEQEFGETQRIQITAFRSLIENTINSFASPSPVNIPGTTATDGLELAWTGSINHPDLQYRLSWTHLHKSLDDQPRNAATATLSWQATEDTMYGIGATHFSSRSYGANDIAAYTVFRLFASHQLTEKVRLHARIENLLDEEYELYLNQGGGFRDLKQGAGTGLYVGVTIDL